MLLSRFNLHPYPQSKNMTYTQLSERLVLCQNRVFIRIMPLKSLCFQEIAGLQILSELQSGHGSVRLWFVPGRVRAVPVFASDDSSGERFSSVCLQSFSRQVRLWFLKSGSGDSGSDRGSWQMGSDLSGLRVRQSLGRSWNCGKRFSENRAFVI